MMQRRGHFLERVALLFFVLLLFSCLVFSSSASSPPLDSSSAAASPSHTHTHSEPPLSNLSQSNSSVDLDPPSSSSSAPKSSLRTLLSFSQSAASSDFYPALETNRFSSLSGASNASQLAQQDTNILNSTSSTVDSLELANSSIVSSSVDSSAAQPGLAASASASSAPAIPIIPETGEKKNPIIAMKENVLQILEEQKKLKAESLPEEPTAQQTIATPANTATSGQPAAASPAPSSPASSTRPPVPSVPLDHDRFNYAAIDAGAKLLATSPNMKKSSSILIQDDDRYMMVPCAEPHKYFIIQLSEDINIDSIELANFEHYSSSVKSFQLFGSTKFPTENWSLLGDFTALNNNQKQTFHISSSSDLPVDHSDSASSADQSAASPLDHRHVRYIKFVWLSHYKDEYYCTLTYFKAFGRTVLEEFREALAESEREVEEIKSVITGVKMVEKIGVPNIAPILSEEEQKLAAAAAAAQAMPVLEVPEEIKRDEIIGQINEEIPAENGAQKETQPEQQLQRPESEDAAQVAEERKSSQPQSSDVRPNPSDSVSTAAQPTSAVPEPVLQTENPSDSATSSKSPDVSSVSDASAPSSSPAVSDNAVSTGDSATPIQPPVTKDSQVQSEAETAAQANSPPVSEPVSASPASDPVSSSSAGSVPVSSSVSSSPSSDVESFDSLIEAQVSAGLAQFSDSHQLKQLETDSAEAAEASHLRAEEARIHHESGSSPGPASSAASLSGDSKTSKTQSIFKALTNRIKDLEIHQAVASQYVAELTHKYSKDVAGLTKQLAENSRILHGYIQSTNHTILQNFASLNETYRLLKEKHARMKVEMAGQLQEVKEYLSLVEMFIQLEIALFAVIITSWLFCGRCGCRRPRDLELSRLLEREAQPPPKVDAATMVEPRYIESRVVATPLPNSILGSSKPFSSSPVSPIESFAVSGSSRSAVSASPFQPVKSSASPSKEEQKTNDAQSRPNAESNRVSPTSSTRLSPSRFGALLVHGIRRIGSLNYFHSAKLDNEEKENSSNDEKSPEPAEINHSYSPTGAVHPHSYADPITDPESVSVSGSSSSPSVPSASVSVSGHPIVSLSQSNCS